MSHQISELDKEDVEWKMASSRKIFTELQQRSKTTPDIDFLEQYDWHLLFVDNILRWKYNKQGMFLKNAKYLGDGRTVNKHFVMKRTSQFPITFFDPKNAASRPTIGDLYAVDNVTLRNFDAMFSNGTMWYREKHFIQCNDQLMPFKQGHKKVTIEAWMYLGFPEAFKDMQLAYATPVMFNTYSAWEWDPDDVIISS